MDPIISLHRLTKFYGADRGVEQIDLEIFPGEIFGYLGPNGAGKTTTIRICLDFLRPTSGTATLFNLDSRRKGVQARRRIGFLPGELFLYEELKVKEYLYYIARLKGGGIQDIPELSDRLSCPLEKTIAALSQGNRRKVGLIQAFMNRPDLIILDEPTNGLDPLIQHEFEALLAEAKNRGQTLFLSSHNLAEVERTCDRVGVIRSGRLIAVERVEELKRRSLRQVDVRFSRPVPPDLFSSWPEVKSVQWEGDRFRFRIQGESDRMIKALSRFPVEDIIIQQPSLEDIFLAYYGENVDAS